MRHENHDVCCPSCHDSQHDAVLNAITMCTWLVRRNKRIWEELIEFENTFQTVMRGKTFLEYWRKNKSAMVVSPLCPGDVNVILPNERVLNLMPDLRKIMCLYDTCYKNYGTNCSPS